MGWELGLGEPEPAVLEYAALMHDIGRLSPAVAPCRSGPPPGSRPLSSAGVDAEVAVVEWQAESVP